MSRVVTDLCVSILRELYGEDHAKVGELLLKMGKFPLRAIREHVNFPLVRVKKVVAALIQQNIISFSQSKKGVLEYSMDTQEILCRKMFQRYLWTVKQMFAGIGDLIMEDMLQNGQVMMGEVVARVHKKWNVFLQSKGKPVLTDTDKVTETFKTLAATHFLQRCPVPEKDAKSRIVGLNYPDEELRYFVPSAGLGAKRKREPAESAPPAKKIKMENESVDCEQSQDDRIYWRVNFERIHEHIHDEVICEAVERKWGEKGKIIMQTILRINEASTSGNALYSTSLTRFEIFRQLPQSSGITDKMLDEYLHCLSDPPEYFLRRTDDSSGGTYTLNFYDVMKVLAMSHIEVLVRERYGSHCLRIFRAVIHAKFIEQRQLESKVMLKPSTAKELLYTLIEESFIEVQELPKSQDWNAKTTTFLFHVNMGRLVRNVLEKCYRAAYNAMVKKQQVLNEHRRLLDKSVRVDYIIGSLGEEATEDQRAEIEDMITDSERKTLNSVSDAIKKLDRAEISINETIFVLESYRRLALLDAQMNAPVKRKFKSSLQDL